MPDNRYPNMSYCMFENTLLAMGQLLDHMNYALDKGPNEVKEFLDDMSKEELTSFRELFNMCREYIKLAEDIESSETDEMYYEEEQKEYD